MVFTYLRARVYRKYFVSTPGGMGKLRGGRRGYIVRFCNYSDFGGEKKKKTKKNIIGHLHFHTGTVYKIAAYARSFINLRYDATITMMDEGWQVYDVASVRPGLMARRVYVFRL